MDPTELHYQLNGTLTARPGRATPPLVTRLPDPVFLTRFPSAPLFDSTFETFPEIQRSTERSTHLDFERCAMATLDSDVIESVQLIRVVPSLDGTHRPPSREPSLDSGWKRTMSKPADFGGMEQPYVSTPAAKASAPEKSSDESIALLPISGSAGRIDIIPLQQPAHIGTCGRSFV